MIIKSFTADSAAAALKQVRSEMGGDAVVLKTRHVTDGSGQKRIEVTACLDKEPVATSSRPSPVAERRITTPRWKPVVADRPSPALSHETQHATMTADVLAGLTVRFDRLEEKFEALANRPEPAAIVAPSDPALDRLELQLAAADVPELFRSVFLATISREHAIDSARTMLVESLADLLLPSVGFSHGDVVVFMGAAGSGKTSMLGKLAARLVLTEKKKVRLLSLDTSKVGAHDEIESYAALLGIEVAEARDHTGISDPACITLIDSSAMPTTVEAFAEFARRLDALTPSHRIAVFSALTRTVDVARQARQMRVLAPTHFAFSMLDLTVCHGAVIAAAEALSVKLALVTDAPGGMGAVKSPDPLRLAEHLLSVEPEVTHE
jgi:flagellar biosynthesis protein FlhF